MTFRNKAYKYIKGMAIKRLEWIRYGWGYNGLKYDQIRNFIALMDLQQSNHTMARYILNNKAIIKKLPAKDDIENLDCIDRMFIQAHRQLQPQTNQINISL